MKCKKKKLLAMFLALTMSVNLFTTSVWAEEDLAEDNQKSVIVEQTLSSGTCGPNLNWTLSDDGILTISGSGRMDSWSGNWHLQPTPWYENRDSIKEVVIEEGVTSIGGDEFRRCSNLTKIVMPKTLTSIQGYAFDYCSSLKDIDIPEGVTHIYEYTFEDCSSLSNINISASVTDIEKYAFTGCSSLK
ncbi:MAG: leucine-rich repeat domain-containing protein, partial [Lachnospiraceae bacterium]|nr:leucine-rich repeat domain-containing protein [Lachnospiraceae bacterium]